MAITKRADKGSTLTHDELDGNFTHLEKKFTVTNSGSGAYVFSGAGTSSDSNPTLYLQRGETYTFAVDASGHPFYINSSSGTGTGNAYNDGVANNGIAVGDIEFTVQQDAPDVLYYNCQYHSSMAGTIHIVKANYSIDDLSDVDTTTSAPSSGQVLKWDGSKWAPAADNNSGGGGGGSSNTFSSIVVGSDTVAADSVTDSVTFVAGSNMTITANTSSDTITFASSGGGGGGGASVTISDASPSSPSAGDLWWSANTSELYIYYNDVDSNQWVQVTTPGRDGTDGSSVTSYENTSAFPSSDNSVGDFAFATDTKAVYIWDGSEWDRISAGVDESPVIITEPPTSHVLSSTGNTTTIQMEAQDPEGFDITYGIAYQTTDNSLPDQLSSDTTVNSNGVYTFTPSSNTSHGGSFKVRLSASDGVKTTTRFTELSLSFSQDVIFESTEPNTSTTLTNTTTGWSASATTAGGNMMQSNTLQTGKRYFEMYVTAQSGIPLVGIYAESNTDPGYNDTDGPALSLTSGDVAPTATFTTSGFDPNGGGLPYTLMIAFDTSARKVWFGLDGSWGSGSGDPTSGSGYTVGGTGGFTLCLGNGTSGGSTLTSNILLDSNLTYSLPAGFQSQ